MVPVLNRIGRWVFFQLGNNVTKEAALEIARTACEAEGVPFVAPVRVGRDFGDWVVWTNARTRGGNVRVEIDGGDGTVKRIAGPTPR